MTSKVENFLKNQEENIFGISVKNEDKEHITFIIDDFEFELSLEKIQLSTKEEILIPICEKVNKMGLKTEIHLLLEFSKAYGEEMGEEQPLYDGQDVFEDENDNNDIKFEERMRLTEDSFPSELFVHVLKFLEPSFVCKLSRVSKKWLKLTHLDVIWKEFCKKEGSTELSEGITRYIDEYKENLRFSIPKEIPFPEFTKKAPPILANAKYFHSNHLYISIESSDMNSDSLKFFISKFQETASIINRESRPTFLIQWSDSSCMKTVNEIQERLINYETITWKKGDMIGYDYNPKTGDISIIYNDERLGVIHSEIGLDLSIILVCNYDYKLVKGKKPTKFFEFKEDTNDFGF